MPQVLFYSFLMNLFIFQDTLEDYAQTICLYAEDLEQCKKLFQDKFKSDELFLIFDEAIENEMYHVIPVLYGTEPKVIILTPQMEELIRYTLFHHVVG